MRIQRPSENGSETGIINISSLVDVMFILIIFFMATTTFRQEERDIKVNLPESAEGGETLSTASKVIVINVRKDGSYVMGTQEATIVEVEKLLVNAVTGDPGQKVLIRGDRQALHGHVAAAVAVCKRAGIHEANIGYQLPR